MDQKSQQLQLDENWPGGATLATTAQLLDAGFGDRMISTALRRGQLVRVRNGAYIRADHWAAQKHSGQANLRLSAHVLTVRGNPNYSYYSAARLHGLFVWNCGALVHVTAQTAVSGSSNPRDVIRHHEVLLSGETCIMQMRDGCEVAVTTLERTVVDCARIGGFHQAVIIGDSALRKGAKLPLMWAMVNAMPGRRGVRKARRVLQALDPRSESPGESRTRLVIAEMDIRQPELQVELLGIGWLYRPDFVWEEERLIVEFDGDSKYFNYRPAPEVLLEERKRERRLMEVGWRFVRFDWADLSDPESMKRRIRAAMGSSRFVAA